MPPSSVEELRIALLVGLQVQHVGGNQRLERPRHGLVAPVLGDEEGLAHMRDVEQARMLAGPVVLGQDAGRDTAPACRSRRRAPCGRRAPHARHGAGSCRSGSSLCAGSAIGFPQRRAFASSLAARCSAPPLSRDLRDFPGRCLRQVTPVGGRRLETSPLSRVPAPARSFGLSVSGAVAPSAPDSKVRSLPRGSSACLS